MLNASWFRVLTFFGVWAIFWLPLALLVSRFTDWQPGEPLTPKQKLIFLASLYLLVPFAIGWKLKAESLTLASLGIATVPNAIWYTTLGLSLSLASLITVFSLETAFGLIDWHWQNAERLLSLSLPVLILSLLISFVEEAVFRGYTFTTLSSDCSFLLATLVSSLIFALLHLIWERTQTLPQIPGLWLMGIVLVVARVVGENTIYLPLGLHAGWIWGLTCIDSAQLLTYQHKNHWISGINQQPLAGVAGIVCLILTYFAISSLCKIKYFA